MRKIENEVRSVYHDPGLPDAEAMIVKAQLVTEIADIIKRRKLTQNEAAALFGLPQPKLSTILRGQFRGVSERKLMDCLTRLGRDIQTVIKPVPRSRQEGRLSVVLA